MMSEKELPNNAPSSAETEMPPNNHRLTPTEIAQEFVLAELELGAEQVVGATETSSPVVQRVADNIRELVDLDQAFSGGAFGQWTRAWLRQYLQRHSPGE